MIINSFKGIHNTTSGRLIGNDSLTDAVDIDIDDSGVLLSRDGYALSKAQAIDDAYSTRDRQAFIVSSGVLYQVDESLNISSISNTSATSFCDFGNILFTNDGLKVESGVATDLKSFAPIHSGSTITINDIVYTKGHDSDRTVYYDQFGAAIEPEFIGADGFPDEIEQIEFFNSSLWCSRTLDNQSVIFYSKPFLYHIFDYESNHIVIPGKILALSRSNDGLVIGTEDSIYLYNDTLTKLSDYGVIPGRPIIKLPNGSVLIHSVRGICTIPFANLTELKVDLPMGDKCSTAVIYEHEKFRYIGLIFNNL